MLRAAAAHLEFVPRTPKIPRPRVPGRPGLCLVDVARCRREISPRASATPPAVAVGPRVRWFGVCCDAPLTSSWEGSGALLANGAYYDWGYNADGQLGDGNTNNSSLPVHVTLPAAIRQVFQGGSGPTNGQTIAILSGGTVWAWDDNQKGQLGDGTIINSSTPIRVNVPKGVSLVTVNSGGYASYAIDRSGRLWAWGGNQNGQLGTGSHARIETQPVDLHIHLTQISSTASNVAALGSR